MKHLFIINPAAGSRDRTREYAPMIRKACNTRGLDFRIEISRYPGHCPSWVKTSPRRLSS